MKDSSIFITTVNIEEKVKQKDEINENGIQKTVGTVDFIVDPINSTKRIDLQEKDKNGKNKFEKLLGKTNDTIKTIAENLKQSVEDDENIEEIEIDFGIAFTQGLNIKLFEIGAKQSLNVKIKLKKKSNE